MKDADELVLTSTADVQVASCYKVCFIRIAEHAIV